jgi:mono/diheme cytochrome c family protein
MRTRKVVTAVAVAAAVTAQAAPRDDRRRDGPMIFADRCSGCHGLDAKGTEDGPSLVGVTARRSRAWLLEWVRGPERLVERGDPVAKQIVSRYGWTMPNLDLGAEEALAVVEHLERATGGAAR